MRKEDQEVGKKILLAQQLGRKRGRQRLYWKHELNEDTRMFRIRNCWIVMSGKGSLRKPKLRVELWSH